MDAEGAVRVALGEAYLTDGPFGEVGSHQAYFSFDRRGGPAGSFECSLDGARCSACTLPQGYSDLSDGVHRFRVRARDAQGLPLESTPVRRAWTVDNTVPQTPTISGPSRTVVNAVERTVFVQGTAEPDGFVDVYQDDHMMFRTRSDDRGNWASRIGVDGNDGEYSYRVGSADMAGNTSDLSSPFSVKVDATTPSVIATSPEGGATGVPAFRDVRLSFSEPMDETTENSNTITLAMEGSKETATVSYDAAGRSATLDPERGLVSGATYTLTVKTGVRDLAGNPLAAEESRTFTVGAEPDTEVTSGPKGTVNTNDATFWFSSNEEGATFQCRLLGAGQPEPVDIDLECKTPKFYEGLPNGAYTFMVAARNPSTKSSDPTPAERAWTVDTLAPAGAVQINDGQTYVASRAVALALSADDPAPGSGVTLVSISNSGEDWSAWRSFSQRMDWILSDVDGQKTVYVCYRDRAKNSMAAARDTITMDTKNPRGTVSINGGDTRTDSRTVTLSLSATDPDPSSGIGRMRFSSNGTDWSSWEPYESRVQRRLSAGAGKKTVYAQYRDRAGNSSERTKDSIYLSP